jgi:hypothetical protein
MVATCLFDCLCLSCCEKNIRCRLMKECGLYVDAQATFLDVLAIYLRTPTSM